MKKSAPTTSPRTGSPTIGYDLRSILDGDLDRLVEPLLERDLKDRLAAAAAAANGSSPNA